VVEAGPAEAVLAQAGQGDGGGEQGGVEVVAQDRFGQGLRLQGSPGEKAQGPGQGVFAQARVVADKARNVGMGMDAASPAASLRSFSVRKSL
jgi:hypothetical protein